VAKLTQEQKTEVINRRANGATVTLLAKEYGVSAAAISQLVKRATMKAKPVEQ